MPSFISNNGIWEPAHERSTYTDKDGQVQIYDGPDRAAAKYIHDEGGTVGQDALKDPQLIQASRNMGFPTVEAYLENFKPTPKQVAEIKEAQSKVITHAPTVAHEGVEPTLGGFNTDDEAPIEVLEQKKRGRPKKGS